jgi:Ca2+-binding RTX toxin-like protein
VTALVVRTATVYTKKAKGPEMEFSMFRVQNRRNEKARLPVSTIESLEERRLFTGYVSQSTNTLLDISGSVLTLTDQTASGSTLRVHDNGSGSIFFTRSGITEQYNISGVLTSLFPGYTSIVMNGGLGADLLEVDSSVSSSANVTLFGESGNDTLLGGASRETLNGGDADDSISGGGNNDLMDGGAGADTLVGGGGSADFITYASRTASVEVTFDGTANDGEAAENDLVSSDIERVRGGSGSDSLTAGSAATTLWGGDGNDTLYGGTQSDSLVGEDGDDYLSSNAGNDTIDGGSGVDRMLGGDGNDVIFARDTVQDNGIFGGTGSDSAQIDSTDDDDLANFTSIETILP